jgi:zinc protease
MEEVKNIKKSGATAEDISKFKSEDHRQMELNLRDNSYWLGYLTTRLKYGDELNQVLSNKQRVDAVTVESSRTAAQQYLNENNYIRLVLMPQSK